MSTETSNSTRVGADVLLDALCDAGVEICFANPGTTELTLVSALAGQSEIRCVLNLFEGVCTGAADGYARVSGKIPATLLHLGPGFANGIANLHNARRAGSRIVNIIGDHATWHLSYDAPLTSDIHSLAAPVSAAVIKLDSIATIADGVCQALAATSLGAGGSAALIVPTDVADAAVGSLRIDIEPPLLQPAPVPHQRLADAAAALADGGELIVLLGGNALCEDGQRAGAAIAAHFGGRLLMEPYPAIVPLGGDLPALERQAYFPDDVIAQMGSARVLLAGARMPISYFGYEGYPSQLVPDERLLLLATPQEDGAAALQGLAQEIGASLAPSSASGPRPAPTEAGAALTPASIVEELLAQLPEDAIISLEGSTLGGPWLKNAHRAARHRVMTNTGGAIGQGLPCAVGAALAAPGKRVVGLQSDGSAQYTLQSLWTMARENLPVTVIIAANHRYAILQTELVRADAPLDDTVIGGLTRLDNPFIDWVALAKGYGVNAIRVTSNRDLAAALKEGFASAGPMLIQAELP